MEEQGLPTKTDLPPLGANKSGVRRFMEPMVRSWLSNFHALLAAMEAECSVLLSSGEVGKILEKFAD